MDQYTAELIDKIVSTLLSLKEASALQAEINKEALSVIQALQKRIDERYDRLEDRLLPILKRLDKLEGKH